MTDDYTPSINDFRELHMDKFTGSERVLAGELFDRAIAAHDAELRSQVRAEIAAEILSHQGEIAAGTWYSAITYAARIAEGTS